MTSYCGQQLILQKYTDHFFHDLFIHDRQIDLTIINLNSDQTEKPETKQIRCESSMCVFSVLFCFYAPLFWLCYCVRLLKLIVSLCVCVCVCVCVCECSGGCID